MKRFSTSLVAKIIFTLCWFTYALPKATSQNIPDPNFAAAIRAACPTCIDGANNLLAPAKALTELNVSFSNISDLSGIEGFTALHWLNCGNNKITNINMLPNNLQVFYCYSNQLTALPTLPEKLETLNCSSNYLLNNSFVNLPANLKKLFCWSNRISSLPSLPTTLKSLWCSFNPITVLPKLPSGLEELLCNGCQLSEVPSIPNSLIWLDCGSNKDITHLPELPSSLEILFCESNKLIALPILPQTLKKLDCGNQSLTVLPALPSSLEELYCYDNQIKSLPTLPSNLKRLTCSGNQLTTLPTLPNTLNFLDCGKNNLIDLPVLPTALKFFFCNKNQLSNLPSLPKGLNESWIFDNKITCLPTLPNSLFSLVLDNDDITCAPNYVDGLVVKNAIFVDIILPICSSTAPILVSGATLDNPSVTVGNTATLRAKATGSGIIKVRWQQKKATESSYTDINGSSSIYMPNTDIIYTTPPLTIPNNNVSFRAVFKSGCSEDVYSLPVTIRFADIGIIFSVGSGDWNNPSTWDCNCVPSATQNVVIKSGHKVALTPAMGPQSCKNLVIEPGAVFDAKGVFLSDPR
ncbi:leucine-rich repeat domain-containing protein [Runella sp. SP2]|uniref:leucine-rich repeat domain-containing protein n=1 Tax=Runella sp. SP2 TaxID=2268026 RepID=UPI000F078E1F|nr:leucine-rich repeat domain-containing protein [Runella sp. SP2]AYQ33907.1 hypothetical protein DTQ70_17885 [Runella sp. SP2]